MEMESIAPLLAVAVSVVAAVLIVVTRRWPDVREGCSVVAGIAKFVIVLTMVPAVLDGKTITYSLWSLAPGIPVLVFRVDALGLLFAVTASFLWIALLMLGASETLGAGFLVRRTTHPSTLRSSSFRRTGLGE